MKQCAGCGNRYEMAQTSCPKCWSRSWVASQDDGGPPVLPQYPNPCSECGFMAEAGMARCPACKSRLRPRDLEWISLIIIAGAPAAIIYTALGAKQDPWSIPDIFIAAAALACAIGLLRGRYWAWVGALAVFIATPVSLLALVTVAEVTKDVQEASMLAGMLLLRSLGVGLLWVYFTTPAVRDFCSFGKPEERREMARNMFPEQMQRIKVDRFSTLS